MTKFEIFNNKQNSYHLKDFYFDLPEKLIAKYPPKKRGDAKLMVLDREKQTVEHHKFSDITNFLEPKDCLVLNDTKVFPARLFATKDQTDAKVEVFLLRQLDDNIWETIVKPARKVRVGNKLVFTDKIHCDIIDNTVSSGRVIRHNCSKEEFMEYIMEHGKSPIPPYIKRESEPIDKIRYQTVFAENIGAVAAPTAGMHFTEKILNKIEKNKVTKASLTLHIGLGTFKPITVEDISRHNMHSEYYDISKDTVEKVNNTMKNGGNIVAVGTSVVRALESAYISDMQITKQNSWTDKFIYPPYKFKIVDKIITNFHQPKSSLIILVSAFANRDFIFKAYKEAIKKKYNFYSYGDAMLII
ncbi:MAG: tRNA preQ1(34) S-adenosylmethionine ribosyltransferase-isomerase QueA [Candidatus Marinimicrobia bacterium]|nr:tRNA preQ1(34) S-adenosylmethionine ribosyltransferase-isomerase QueA [Candidatus Neomarinimicrobiota bacterium]